jgi:hypothetical protein
MLTFVLSVFQGMLSQGAILSRYFAQSLYQRLSNQLRLRGNTKWGQDIDSLAVHQVYIEAHRLYGNSFKYASTTTDGNEVRYWAEVPTRRVTLTDEIREIFEQGKFAIFSSEDSNFSSLYPLSTVFARFPELLRTMKENGYEYNDNDQGRIVRAILESRLGHKEIYSRLEGLLIEQPDWIMTAENTEISDLLRKPWSTSASFPPVPLDEANTALLKENDGHAPLEDGFAAMKALFEEGKAFGDLEKAAEEVLVQYRQNWEYSKLSEQAATLRILLQSFPSLCQDHRTYAAGAC